MPSPSLIVKDPVNYFKIVVNTLPEIGQLFNVLKKSYSNKWKILNHLIKIKKFG